jgi:sortase A
MRDARTLRRLLVVAGSALVLAVAVLLALWAMDVFWRDGGSAGSSDAGTVTGFDLRLERSRAAGTATAEATPPVTRTAVPKGEVPERLVIPSIGVDAPIVVLGLDAQGVMESPSGPEDVGWYDFTARPGAPGNAVFSGHVDFHDYGEAVFWDLHKLKSGDIIEVHGKGGSVYRYQVVSSLTYPAGEAPVGEVVGETERETVTLITCAGTFNSDVHQYSHRLVVQAERVEEGEPAVGQ